MSNSKNKVTLICSSTSLTVHRRHSRSQHRHLRSLCAEEPCAPVIRGPWGQNLGPKLSSLGGYETPLGKTSYTTPHTIQNMRFDLQIKLWDYPFK